MSSTLLENPFLKQVDTIWDAWLTNLKTAQQIQDDVQEKALQAFSYQKELIDSSIQTFGTFEEESKKISKEWSESLKANLGDNPAVPTEQVAKWISSVQDVTDTVQTLAWKPSQILLDVYVKSQKQLEENVKKVLDVQKAERTEGFKKIEELIEQVKSSQKEILNIKPINE